MDESAITTRYAKAVFLLAKESNTLDNLKHDSDVITEVCRNSSDFIRLLTDPIILISEKIKVIDLIFKGNIDDTTLNFLKLITQNRRESYIPRIFMNVNSYVREAKNIRSVTVTTAQPLDEELLNRSRAVLEKELAGDVEITGRVNPKIIGGVIINVDGKQYDNSVATGLKKLKQELLNRDV